MDYGAEIIKETHTAITGALQNVFCLVTYTYTHVYHWLWVYNKLYKHINLVTGDFLNTI